MTLPELKLPGCRVKFEEEPIMHVDATPDPEYPVRILRAHREHQNYRWVVDSGSENLRELVAKMEAARRRRAQLLDEAIRILEQHMRSDDIG